MPIKHLNIWRKYLPDTMFVNIYGPTEITCNCTYYIVDRDFEPGDVLPMGKAFPNEKSSFWMKKIIWLQKRG